MLNISLAEGRIVKDSEVFVDMTAQKLGAVGGKNPRTAIGYTTDNDMIMVAVDGREGLCRGIEHQCSCGFYEVSWLCQCYESARWGGSTVMYVDGRL